MRIAIVGAGAIGGWLGISLADAGHHVSVLARGDTLAALREGPWKLQRGDVVTAAQVIASDIPSDLGVQDIVIIAVKGPALPGLAPSLAPLIGPDTIVVPAMNGVPWWFLLAGGGELSPTRLSTIDPDNAIAAAIPFTSVLGSVVHVAATSPKAGHVWLKAGNRLILGQPDHGSAQLDRIAPVLEQAGIGVERSAHIQKDVWYKLWGNMTMNPISAITGATCDRVLDDNLVAGFVLRVMAEAQEIGSKIGCRIDERGEDRNAVTRQLGAFKTSMLQDVEAGRPLELDQLVSAPREIAELLGVATPNLDALLGLSRLFAQSRGLYPNG